MNNEAVEEKAEIIRWWRETVNHPAVVEGREFRATDTISLCVMERLADALMRSPKGDAEWSASIHGLNVGGVIPELMADEIRSGRFTVDDLMVVVMLSIAERLSINW